MVTGMGFVKESSLFPANLAGQSGPAVVSHLQRWEACALLRAGQPAVTDLPCLKGRKVQSQGAQWAVLV